MQPGGPQGMQPYGQNPAQGAAIVGMAGGTTASSGPKRRDALMTLLPYAVIFGGGIVFNVLARVLPSMAGIFGLLSSLVNLGGLAWFFVSYGIPMIAELRSVTQSESLVWWPLIVPFYNLYFMWMVVPPEVAKAKQMLGVQTPPRSMVHYVFLWPYALASDLNDMVR
jgi:hypothetical protein